MSDSASTKPLRLDFCDLPSSMSVNNICAPTHSPMHGTGLTIQNSVLIESVNVRGRITAALLGTGNTEITRFVAYVV